MKTLEQAIDFFHRNDVDCYRAPGIVPELYRLERVKGTAGVIVYISRDELVRRATAAQLPRITYNPLDWQDELRVEEARAAAEVWYCDFCGQRNERASRYCGSCGVDYEGFPF
jgi:hypothetical protein